MNRADLNFMMDQAANEGWNPGLYDADTFYEADQNGFFVAEIEGKQIGCISLVKYDETFAFLGFFIVLPEYRGKGIGYQLWQHAIKYAEGCNIGLDGVVDQQENYKKSGFKFAYNNSRYEFEKTTNYIEPANVIQINEIAINDLCEYDKTCFPTYRKTFLKNWISQPDSAAFASRNKQLLEGYIVVRKCRNGYKIGPLFADTSAQAEDLLISAISCLPIGEKVYLDIPEINPAAVRLVQKYKMQKVFETARMYTLDFPNIDLHKIFGVTTFELG